MTLGLLTLAKIKMAMQVIKLKSEHFNRRVNDNLIKTGYFCLVIFLPIGRWCIRDKLEAGWREDSWLFRFYLLENFISYVEKCIQNQFVIILDLSECSYRKVAHYESNS